MYSRHYTFGKVRDPKEFSVKDYCLNTNSDSVGDYVN